jgi:hypothetical protein
MSLLAEVRRAVAARIEQYDATLNVFAYPPATYVAPAVLIYPAPELYVAYHRTFGPARLIEINLIATVVVPEGQSTQSAQEVLDGFLSSGGFEAASIVDAITGNDITIGATTAAILAAEATNVFRGEIAGPAGTAIRTVSADLPISVNLHRIPEEG